MEQNQTRLAPSAPVYLAFTIFFIIFCTFLVFLRFWSRHLKETGYGWDDWFMLAALPAFYGQMAVQLYAVFGGGLGWHVDQVSEQQQQNLLMELTIIQFTYAVVFLLIRLSIASLLLRIFVQPWLRRIVKVGIVMAILWSIFVLVTALTVCIPFEANWNRAVPGAKCNAPAQKASYVVNAIWSIIYDTVIWTLPQFSVWRLNMQKAAKVTLSAVFALGIFDIVISIVRIIEVNSLNFEDLNYASWGGHFWSMMEVAVAMIVACAPMCKQGVEKLLPARFKSLFTRRSEPASARYNYNTSNSNYMELEEYQHLKTAKVAPHVSQASSHSP